MKSFTSYFLIVFLIVVYACEKQNKTKDTELSVVDTINIFDKKYINRIGVTLKPNTKKQIKGWKEYQLVDAILINYYAISNAEALSNAQELSRLVIKLKDSISDEKLMMPSIKARISILHNECIRLNDMASIPAITPKEVSETITRILAAYSGLNAKLNSVYGVKELENELELDPDFLKILNDTIDNSLWDVKKSEKAQKVNRVGEVKRNTEVLKKSKKPIQKIQKKK